MLSKGTFHAEISSVELPNMVKMSETTAELLTVISQNWLIKHLVETLNIHVKFHAVRLLLLVKVFPPVHIGII